MICCARRMAWCHSAIRAPAVRALRVCTALGAGIVVMPDTAGRRSIVSMRRLRASWPHRGILRIVWNSGRHYLAATRWLMPRRSRRRHVPLGM